MGTWEGCIEKMRTELGDTVQYALPIGAKHLELNPYLGRFLRLEHQGTIRCIHCDRKTKKSFNQGYCYPCFRSLAQCDMCIVRPETCHLAEGTCREPEWGNQHCQIPHTVYLANSSGLKVGITRQSQQSTRWIDQGASQALPVLTVATRLDAGRAEVILKEFVSDRTDWRKMLKGVPPFVDLRECRDDLLRQAGGSLKGSLLPQAEVVEIDYPVMKYPEKVQAHNLDKLPLLEDRLLGIKGQYLIFETCVINVRKYAGYQVTLSFE